jgi:hypothetical protein
LEILSEVSDVELDSILSRTIYNSNGQVLLAKGSKLTEEYIDKLKELNINNVYIDMTVEYKNLKEVEVKQQEIIPEQLKKEAVSIAKNCINKSKTGLDDLIPQSQEEIIKIIDNIIEEISGLDDLFNNLKDMRRLEDELFFHLGTKSKEPTLFQMGDEFARF